MSIQNIVSLRVFFQQEEAEEKGRKTNEKDYKLNLIRLLDHYSKREILTNILHILIKNMKYKEEKIKTNNKNNKGEQLMEHENIVKEIILKSSRDTNMKHVTFKEKNQ